MNPEKAPKVLHGRVTGKRGIYWVVETPEAPEHLRIHHLTRVQMNSGDVGDRVTLVYHATNRYGLWIVDTVLPREREPLSPRWRDGFPLRDDPTSDI